LDQIPITFRRFISQGRRFRSERPGKRDGNDALGRRFPSYSPGKSRTSGGYLVTRCILLYQRSEYFLRICALLFLRMTTPKGYIIIILFVILDRYVLSTKIWHHRCLLTMSRVDIQSGFSTSKLRKNRLKRSGRPRLGRIIDINVVDENFRVTIYILFLMKYMLDPIYF
jgi:hypothetical protein